MEKEEGLTYDKVVLRSCDLDLLRGPHFLSDSLIEFYFSYLFNSQLPDVHDDDDTQIHSKSKDDILLVPPTLSYWVANSLDSQSLNGFEESHKVAEKQLVIFTVNNNKNVSQIDGGTHWSLLVFYRKSNTFVHYDSLGGLNHWDARKLYGAVKHVGGGINFTTSYSNSKATDTTTTSSSSSSSTIRFRGNHHKKYMKRARNIRRVGMMCRAPHWFLYNLMVKGVRDDDDDDDDERKAAALWVPQCHHGYLNTPRTSSYYVDDKNEPCFRELPTPRQTNLYDCGLYVMAIARVICQWYCAEASSATATATHVDDEDEGHDARFPNIMKHVDNSLESTMRSELLEF
ncbi:PREDICTED: sentrin-specific protease 8 [Prunus dulcis]|uniref:PREDICTED: sentrin-specific protease 8 n=1 Tax=Prunus dulcis TaxID=3755 RepID=A0A5E4EII6_PRUDU|nr:PREDICTED: sentrin-specific protease 8 [Prunus dulcis]